jgi:biotin transport system substrate-specific component
VARLEIAVEGDGVGQGRLLVGGMPAFYTCGNREWKGQSMASVAVARPLVEHFVPDEGTARIAALAGFAVLGSLILWASAKISVPFWPVPMTLQTGAVLLIGAAYGWRLGLATVVLYLAQGAAGLPVFQGTPPGMGIPYMLGPTGGYLAGFAVAAAIVGWLAERGWDRGPVKLYAAMLIADAAIFAFGLAWLGTVIGWDKPVLELGFYPFILGDLLKIALAACLVAAGAHLVRS